MDSINRAWTLLFGAQGPVDTDWVRLTEPVFGGVSPVQVFNDADPSIRGWLVEATVRAALRSTYREQILASDPLNTYALPLSGETAHFSTTLSGGAVYPADPDYGLAVYSNTVSYELEVVEGGYLVVSVDGVAIGTTISTTSRLINLMFVGTSVVNLVVPADAPSAMSFTITGKVLPSEPPLVIVKRRTILAFPGRGFETWPVVELMGWLVTSSLEGRYA